MMRSIMQEPDSLLAHFSPSKKSQKFPEVQFFLNSSEAGTTHYLMEIADLQHVWNHE